MGRPQKAILKRPKVVGERIRFLRKEKGMTQEELANRVGVTTPFITRLEKEWSRDMRASTAVRLADALGTAVEHLYSYS